MRDKTLNLPVSQVYTEESRFIIRRRKGSASFESEHIKLECLQLDITGKGLKLALN